MKNIFIIMSLFFLFNANGTAQTKNVDVDNYWINVVYREFPNKPQNPMFFYYSTAVNASAAVQKNISIDEVNDALYIDAQRKTQEADRAEMALRLTLESILIKSSRVVDDVTSTKNKDGSVTKTHQYYVEVIYNFASSYEIKSREKNLSEGSIYSKTSSQEYRTEKYSTSNAASDFWNNNRELLITEFYRRLCMESASWLSTRASSLYGFPVKGLPPQKEPVRFKTIDEKKHNENQPFRANAEKLKDALQSMTPDIPMNRERADSLIEYFKNIPVRYTDPKLKADVRLRYAAYYNLCIIYLFLDEPDKVYEYADLILSNGYDPKDGERLKKEADALKAALNKTEIKTRHFNPDDYFSE